MKPLCPNKMHFDNLGVRVGEDLAGGGVAGKEGRVNCVAPAPTPTVLK